jgi:hypothetical protein
MKKNIVFFTTMDQAPDNIEYKRWCFESWKYWCDKHGIEIFILDEPLFDKNLMKPTWQRWHVLEILESNGIEYDQVALVDVDTLIHPDAPNFFELTDHKFSAVQDDLMVEWIHNSIEGYKDMFPVVNLNWTNYFNCGFIVINETHKQLCKQITDFYYNNLDELRHRQHHSLRKGSDQTPVNYMANLYSTVNFLDKRWNFTHLHQRGVLNQMLPDVGYVYHFNGFDKNMRNELMQQCWNMIKEKCNV